MLIDHANQGSCFCKISQGPPARGLVQPCQDLSFPRILLDSSGYAPIGGWDFKEKYTVPIGRDIAGNDENKLGTSRMSRTKFSVLFSKHWLSIIIRLW